jgi:SAM-dependent methyltransferase
VADDRERMRTTFDVAADRYDRARPRYPSELFDALFGLTGVGTGDRVLEIGPATGIVTRELAGRGLVVTAVELGGDLAAAARHRLAGLGDVEIVHADFDTWSAPAARFDLVVAATSWHWLDPVTRLDRVADALRPGGHLAHWAATHAFPPGGDPFFQEIQDVYDEIGEGLPPDADWPAAGELPDERAELDAHERFEDVAVRRFAWVVEYDADGYVDLLETFSGHIAMEEWQRERLYGEIRRRLAARPDGRLRRGWGAVLHVARRV